MFSCRFSLSRAGFSDSDVSSQYRPSVFRLRLSLRCLCCLRLGCRIQHSTMPLYTLTITHPHTLTGTCTCCHDKIEGTQDQDLFSCSFSDFSLCCPFCAGYSWGPAACLPDGLLLSVLCQLPPMFCHQYSHAVPSGTQSAPHQPESQLFSPAVFHLPTTLSASRSLNPLS